jgi:hypothetical protein
MRSRGLTYFILTISFIFLQSYPVSSHNSTTEHSFSESHLISISSYNIIENLRSIVNESKLSFLSNKPNQNELKTVLYFAFIFFFIILLIIKFSSPEYFPDLFSSLFKKNHLLSRITKTRFSISINSILLDFIYLFVVSFFFYLYLYSFARIEYYLIFAGLLGFTIIQFILINISYRLFFGSGSVNIHLTNILITNRITGIIFAPLLFIITYIHQNYQASGLNILLFLFVSIIIIRIYRILNQLKFIYDYSFSYIIIYICTFELSVYFLCFKIVTIFINT